MSARVLGDGNRVGDVGLAGLARLALVGIRAELIGANDGLNLFAGKVALERIHKMP